MISTTELDQLLREHEDHHLEFKRARNEFNLEKLINYSVALANEGGGRLVLGVADERPRKVVGCDAFRNLNDVLRAISDALHLRAEIEEIQHPSGRVLIFRIPARPLGMPIQHRGAYWMRSGESLVPMTGDQLKRILDECGPDFSAELAPPEVSLADLDATAIADFRTRWMRKSGNRGLENSRDSELLRDAELIRDERVTYAALVLFGTNAALGRWLAQAELVFEYRSAEASIPFNQRLEFRQGFFGFYEELWRLINLRNDRQSYREGLFMLDLATFNESAVREAILNAISHRDYRHGGSIFVRQYPRRLTIVSPGGFPPGITPENILDRQFPRNRRIAETFAKCGLIERSGQGMNRIFEAAIKESKPLPNFADSDEHQVSLSIDGQIQDPRFIQFLEKVGDERMNRFTTRDFLVLDLLHRDQRLPEHLKPRLPHLIDLGVIEVAGGRGKHARYFLSRSLYSHLGEKGVYTRRRGLDRDTNKQLLLKHINDNAETGSRMREFLQVLPSLTRDQVRKLVRELRASGDIASIGARATAVWYPSSKSPKRSTSK